MSHDPSFTPVPVRARRDGWTLARQAAFVAALRARRNIVAACRDVGMSWQSAYRLRARPGAASFAAAWDEALADPHPAEPYGGRAVVGVVTPVFYRGRRIGERHRVDNRLAKYLLRRRVGWLREAEHPARPSEVAYAEALAALETDLADGRAPADRDFSRDATRSSSPFGLPKRRSGAWRGSAAALRSGDADRRHPALRGRQHLRPPPARRDPVEARV